MSGRLSGAASRRAVVLVVTLGAVLTSCAEAATTSGNSASTAPADSAAQSTAPASTVVDTTAAAESTATEGPRWASGDDDVLFDQERLHTFEIDLAEESLAFLDTDPAAEEYVEGRLTFDGEVIEPIGVRYKGSVGAFIGCTAGPNPFAASGPKTCTKLSMKLKINWDDPDREFYGVRRVQLHAQNLDPSMMHERLGYWLFREMGVPAPRSSHARVVVNGDFLGVFALTEEIDGRFTRDRFDDGKGNLYKEVWPFTDTGAARPTEDFIAALETNEDDSPSAEIIATFAAEVAASDPTDRIAVIDRWVDLDLLLRTFVVDRAIRHDDGPLHWYCMPTCEPHNFYWYEEPGARRLALVPWDLDNAFDPLVPGSVIGGFTAIADRWGEVSNDCQPFPHGSFGLLQRSAACDPLIAALATLDDEYRQIRDELLAGPFAPERVAAQLAAWSAQIEPAVAEAAELHDDAPSVATWRAALATLDQAVATSRAGDGR